MHLGPYHPCPSCARSNGSRQTLAVGVNLRALLLPIITTYGKAEDRREAAHTVVIKGVKLFRDGAMKEYTDLEIMQMIGRAVSGASPSLLTS